MSNVKDVTQASFDADVLRSDKLVVVDFWAEWCGPCKMLGPELEAAASEMGDDVAVRKVDVDENQEIAGRYGIMSIPTLLFFRNGEPVERLIGFTRRKQLVQKMKQVLGISPVAP